MIPRGDALHLFVNATFVAFDQFARAPDSRRSVSQICAGLETPGVQSERPGSRLPVCAYLEEALQFETSHQSLRCLIERFKSIEPMLEWRRRSTYDTSASDNFIDGHANAVIIGPGGLEDRRDAWLGVTLMAPNVRYPDHDHPPEEVYLILSDGDFRQGDGDWFTPGVGGSFYNKPNIKHAMRSGDTPLLAFWTLRAGPPPEQNDLLDDGVSAR